MACFYRDGNVGDIGTVSWRSKQQPHNCTTAKHHQAADADRNCAVLVACTAFVNIGHLYYFSFHLFSLILSLSFPFHFSWSLYVLVFIYSPEIKGK